MSLRSLTPSATYDWIKELQNKNILTNYEKKHGIKRLALFEIMYFILLHKITFICCIESWLNQPLGKAYSHRQKNQ